VASQPRVIGSDNAGTKPPPLDKRPHWIVVGCSRDAPAGASAVFRAVLYLSIYLSIYIRLRRRLSCRHRHRRRRPLRAARHVVTWALTYLLTVSTPARFRSLTRAVAGLLLFNTRAGPPGAPAGRQSDLLRLALSTLPEPSPRSSYALSLSVVVVVVVVVALRCAPPRIGIRTHAFPSRTCRMLFSTGRELTCPLLTLRRRSATQGAPP
jgi:hypothetical protein